MGNTFSMPVEAVVLLFTQLNPVLPSELPQNFVA